MREKGVAGVQDRERAWVGPGRLARGMVGGALVRAPESSWRWRTPEVASVRRARVASRARTSTRNAAPQGHLRAARSQPLNHISLRPTAAKHSQRSHESGGHEVPELVDAEWLPTDLPPRKAEACPVNSPVRPTLRTVVTDWPEGTVSTRYHASSLFLKSGTVGVLRLDFRLVVSLAIGSIRGPFVGGGSDSPRLAAAVSKVVHPRLRPRPPL